MTNINEVKLRKVSLSVVIPVLNEVNFIDRTLASILGQDFTKENIEILIIDGGSTDGTLEIIDRYVEEFDFVHHIHNANGSVPYALNLGIKEACGSIFMRMDCHSIYPKNYITTLVTHLQDLDADNVGAVVNSVPPDDSCTSEAISIALSSKYGVGNSTFRTGSDSIQKVDTVPFGCYKLDALKKLGGFDVSLTRNQDDELNARLIRDGGVIYLIPNIEISYFTRNSLAKVANMFYQYGLFKPLVNKKVGQLSSYRQLAPPIFVFSLVIALIGNFFHPSFSLLFFSIIFSYFVFLSSAVLSSNIPSLRNRTRALLVIIFPTVHFSYGFGYWVGLLNILIKRHEIEGVTPSR